MSPRSPSRSAHRDADPRVIAAALLLAAGIALTASASHGAGTEVAPARSARPSPAAIAALDCDRLSARDIRDTLAASPAPRIIAISGSFDLVTMDSFARFLAARTP